MLRPGDTRIGEKGLVRLVGQFEFSGGLTGGEIIGRCGSGGRRAGRWPLRGPGRRGQRIEEISGRQCGEREGKPRPTDKRAQKARSHGILRRKMVLRLPSGGGMVLAGPLQANFLWAPSQ